MPERDPRPSIPAGAPEGFWGAPHESGHAFPPVPPVAAVTPDRIWLHVLLLIITFATTTVVGALHYYSFLIDFVPRPLVFTTLPQLFARGFLTFSLPLMAILVAHEAGHYLACRYYGVNASLPYFLPLPPFLGMTGTLGAFIRIRSPLRTKPMLFDMAVAGPLAGFAVLLPLLVLGLGLSRMVKLPPDFSGYWLGEPLLFQLLSWAIKGPAPAGYTLNLHPVAMAAWFGMLVTAINLFPFGQLDGGHISYAVLGRRSSTITIICLVVAILLAINTMSWILWAVLLVIMLLVFGPHHPPTLDDHVPLDTRRRWIAVLALLVFVACFTPAPIEPYELIRPR